jgi:hypothetical protein
MNQPPDIRELRRQVEEQRKQEHKEVEDRYEEAIKGINGLARFFRESTEPATPPPLLPRSAPGKQIGAVIYPLQLVAWPGFRRAVWDAINMIWSNDEETFSTPKIEAFLKRKFPKQAFNRAKISGELWRLKKYGRIKIVKEGRSREPGLYRLPTESESALASSASSGSASDSKDGED